MKQIRFSWLSWRDLIDFGTSTIALFGAPQVFADFLRARNVRHSDKVAVNATATITAANLAKGYVSSTSAAAVTLTLPTATQLATELSAKQGTTFDFIIDNSAGANTITLALGTGITTSNQLTITTANGVAQYRLFFTSNTAANLKRITS